MLDGKTISKIISLMMKKISEEWMNKVCPIIIVPFLPTSSFHASKQPIDSSVQRRVPRWAAGRADDQVNEKRAMHAHSY
jgi:hypothetical protein